ncbi:GGDEF domain-containing protein [Spongisporangium articulatum]|uniref:GGDEF domain-containing protein n=1 Tax=Spongisporangium articulatum TaxID=3362603 RepID=A0ABW8AKA4_9ACTN
MIPRGEASARPGPGQPAPSSLTSWLGGWDYWTLPTSLRCYIAAVGGIWALGLLWGMVVMPYRLSDVGIFLLLTTCGIVAVEAQRVQGEPSGMTKDLLSAWWLPIALVLPPAYSLVAPILLMVQFQVRVRRSPVYRRVFSVFAIGLAHAVASLAFTATIRALGDPVVARGWAVLGWAGAGLLAAAIATLLAGVVVAAAVKLSSPEESWWDLLSRENMTIDVGELCLGVMLSILAMLNPLLLLIAVVPVVLLQRVLVHDQLTAAARTDPKTGLLNALAWEREATVEISRASRSRTPLSVMLLDLDHFKQVNDQHGHLVGDEVLRKVATVMREQTREYDSCARFGGDEFAVLLPNSDLAEARATATRILRNVDEIRVVVGSDVVGTSVSIGVADLTHRGEGVTDLLAAADLALYRAKSAGRHQLG